MAKNLPNLRQVLECARSAPLSNATANTSASISRSPNPVPPSSPNLAIPWPHAPTHEVSASGTYIVTAATYEKAHYFRSAKRLVVLHRGLLKITSEYHWTLEAWAVFSNHYHFVAHSPPTSASTLPAMLATLHNKTSAWINRLDGKPNRKVWHNYWETRLTYQRAYLARLNYVHQNPVRHGLVPVANEYPFCSAAWFERSASPAMVRSIYRFNSKGINLCDDYDVSPDW